MTKAENDIFLQIGIDMLKMVKAVQYVCENQPYKGYDDLPHEKCICAGMGSDGLPVCNAADGYVCPNRDCISILRKWIGGNGLAFRNQQEDGAKRDALPLSVPSLEPTEAQEKYAKAISDKLDIALPKARTKSEYHKFISENKQEFDARLAEEREQARKNNEPTIEDYDDDDCPFDMGEFC